MHGHMNAKKIIIMNPKTTINLSTQAENGIDKLLDK